MIDNQRDIILKELYEAFSAFEKPVPLTTYHGSNSDEEVDVFNKTDWENATYLDFVDGIEGWIICPPKTKSYLLPRLFKMVFLRRSGVEDGAIDNLSAELEYTPLDPSVEPLLNTHQKVAVIAAWKYLDEGVYRPSGSDIARKLSNYWNIKW